MVLAEQITAKDDLPPFRASVMDGYAIRAEIAIEGAVLEVVRAKKGLAGAKAKEL
jgi:molybdopterin biosynthesis enzyme